MALKYVLLLGFILPFASVMPPLVGAMLILLVFIPIQLFFNVLWANAFRRIQALRSTKGAVPFWGPLLFCSVGTIIIALYNSSLVNMPWLSQFRAIFYATVPKSGVKPMEILLIWVSLSSLATLLERSICSKRHA